MNRPKENFESILIEIVGIVREFPYRDLKLFGYTSNYMSKVVTRLKKKGEIEVYLKDSLKGIRLTSKALNKLKVNECRYNDIDYVNRNKSNKTKRIRIHKIATTVLLMYKSDVKIFRDNKPLIEGTKLHKINQTNTPIFYSSVELKRENPDKFKAISSSRFVGILLTNNKQLIVYNCGNTLMRWSKLAENRALLFFKYLEENNKYQDTTRQIMIVDDLSMLEVLLNTVNNKPTKLGFRVNLENEGFYCIPQNLNGTLMIRLLYDSNTYNKLLRTVTVGFKNNNEYSVQFIDLDGRETITCFLLDMVKLIKFTSNIKRKSAKGRIICFDFQQQAIERYCSCLDIVITTVDSKKAGEIMYGS